MMSGLVSNLNDRDQRLENRLTNRPDVVRVLVEDETDIPVWSRILGTLAPGRRFRFTPYGGHGGGSSKGKGPILRKAADFGPSLIGCVDSDYDWLLGEESCYGRVMARSPYILQTYAYSIENLACLPYGLADEMLRCGKHSCELQWNLDRDFDIMYRRLSRAVYPVLTWVLTLRRHGRLRGGESLRGIWDNVLGNGMYEPDVRVSGITIAERRERIMARLEGLAAAEEARLSAAYPELAEGHAALEGELRSRCGVTPETAALYVRGHNLFEWLHYTFFGPTEREIRAQHEREILETAPTRREVQARINHYHRQLRSFRDLHQDVCGFVADARHPLTCRLTAAVKAAVHDR